MTTKRVFELNVGDVFTYTGIRRVVVKIENGFIYYRNYGVEYKAMHRNYNIGWKSKERVEYHFNVKEKE